VNKVMFGFGLVLVSPIVFFLVLGFLANKCVEALEISMPVIMIASGFILAPAALVFVIYRAMGV